MLLIIAAVLAVLWLLGFIGHIGGGIVHILLVTAIIVIAYNFLRGHKRV
jgi:hypothetical protein